MLAMGVDAVVVMAGLSLGTFAWGTWWGGRDLSLGNYYLFALVSLPLWIAVFRFQGFYHHRDDTRTITDIRKVTTGVLLGSAAFILMGWPFSLVVPRAIVVVAVVLLVPMLLIDRQVFRVQVRRRRRAGIGIRPVAILGTNAEAEQLAALVADPTLGRNVVAFISTDAIGEDGMLGDIPVVHTGNPARTASRLGAKTVMIAATALDAAAPSGMLRSFLDHDIDIEMTSALTGVSHSRLQVTAVDRVPMLSIEPGFRGGWRAKAKRLFDIVIASTGLLLGLPLIAAAAIAIKLDSPGPVFFRQKRLGKRGRHFEMLKLRTMEDDAEARLPELWEHNEASGPLFKMSDDPRITRVGRFLRVSSLDELPQLWNVVKGDMSIVGPRPALPGEAAEWGDELRNRLRVRPGMTGMWQVSGRSEAGFDEYERLDMFYIDNWSVLTDLGIMLRTIPAVISRRGAS
jgi:exopolysaccharide biosynthesis polyprenyl glycosylphosphotransferase